MGFRADGTTVLRSLDGESVGYAIAFTADAARRIADALNAANTGPDRELVDPLTGETSTAAAWAATADRPLSEVMHDGRYVKIIGPYATAKMQTADGSRQIRSLAAGAILPGDVTAGQARHLIDVGLAAVVEADTATQVYEAAPTERQRVEMASADVNRPTVSTPEPGSPAAAYDTDPVAAARTAAKGTGQPVVAQMTGAGLGLTGDTPTTAAAPAAGVEDETPAGNASRDQWVSYARDRGASDDELQPVDKGGLTRDELRTRYGS